MFRSDGTPVRATLIVTFRQYKTIAEQLQDPRRNSADKTKRRVLEAHDSIWLLAAREYGEPRFWRLIAVTNDIDDPRRIEPGRVLVLPPITDDDRREAVDGSVGLEQRHGDFYVAAFTIKVGREDVLRDLYLAVSTVTVDLKERAAGQLLASPWSTPSTGRLASSSPRRQEARGPARAVHVRQLGGDRHRLRRPGHADHDADRGGHGDQHELRVGGGAGAVDQWDGRPVPAHRGQALPAVGGQARQRRRCRTWSPRYHASTRTSA